MTTKWGVYSKQTISKLCLYCLSVCIGPGFAQTEFYCSISLNPSTKLQNNVKEASDRDSAPSSFVVDGITVDVVAVVDNSRFVMLVVVRDGLLRPPMHRHQPCQHVWATSCQWIKPFVLGVTLAMAISVIVTTSSIYALCHDIAMNETTIVTPACASIHIIDEDASSNDDNHSTRSTKSKVRGFFD
jgi:hypothetical protein